MIGDDVSITVLGVNGNQVRLGIDAPRSVAVHREEIYQRIQREHAGEGAPHEPSPPVEVPGQALEETSPAQRQEQNLDPNRLRR